MPVNGAEHPLGRRRHDHAGGARGSCPPACSRSTARSRSWRRGASHQTVSTCRPSSCARARRTARLVGHGPNVGNSRRGRVVAHHDLVAQPLDQRAGDRRGDRRDQVDPVGGQARRQERHRDQEPPQAAHAGRSRASCRRRSATSGPPISMTRPALSGISRRVGQVVQNVPDARSAGRGSHPARADHDRQAFGQVADHLERQAARADDDRRRGTRSPARRLGAARRRSPGGSAGARDRCSSASPRPPR